MDLEQLSFVIIDRVRSLLKLDKLWTCEIEWKMLPIQNVETSDIICMLLLHHWRMRFFMLRIKENHTGYQDGINVKMSESFLSEIDFNRV